MRPMTPDDLYAITWLSDCAISPDGATVAFVQTRMDREEDTYRSAIWVVPTDGSAAARQFTAGAKRDTAPRFSPDGRFLAFLSERGEEKPQLFVIPTDGGEARQLTKLPFGAGAPVWSPDSTKIAFSAKAGTPPDPDTKKAKPFRRIASLKYKLNAEGFTYDRRAHIFVVEPATDAEPVQLTDGDWSDTQPAWSPDGSVIAFASARHEEREFDTLSDIFVVAAGGGDARQLTATSGGCSAPSWSPDALTVGYYFRAQRIANSVPWACNADGSNHRPLDPAFDRAPAGALR